MDVRGAKPRALRRERSGERRLRVDTSRYVHLDEAVQSAVERVSAAIASLLHGAVDRPAQPNINVFSIGSPTLLTGAGFGFTGTVTARGAPTHKRLV